MSISRRSFVAALPVVTVPALIEVSWASPIQSSPSPAGPVSAIFPTQAPELAREMVGASHGNLARVKELLARHQTLALASWDWGFGDWEDALGAASHVGNREIAALLIANGARPTIFSAAMLGQLDVVRALIAASPGLEAITGPHSITLMRHAMAGGEAAAPVVEYLKTLPASDIRPGTAISPEELAALEGTYVFGAGADHHVVIAQNKVGLTFLRAGTTARNLVHTGNRTFFPVGAPKVAIRFAGDTARMRLTVHDPDPVLTAERRK